MHSAAVHFSPWPTIIIEPAVPDVCYLPIYDPWTVYGAPLAVYPGFIFDPWVGPEFFFGPPIGLGFFGGFGWGWPAWGFNWGRRQVLFNHNIYVSRSPSFFHRFPGERGDLRPGRSGPLFHGRRDVVPIAIPVEVGWTALPIAMLIAVTNPESIVTSM